MLLDQVTNSQMQGARVLIGATMVAFLGAPMFFRQARAIQVIIAGLYFAGVLGFFGYFLF
jgi:hypothetical protein